MHWRPCSARSPRTMRPPRARGHKEFAEAVRLLESPNASLETVKQYALGANWPLACVALAALRTRSDGSEIADDVVAHFDKIYPSPISRLSLPGVRGRAAAGRRARGGGQGLVGREPDRAPALFATTSPSASAGPPSLLRFPLDARSASPHATIKAFLQRVHHPFSMELTQRLRQLPARQHRPHLPRLVRPLLRGRKSASCWSSRGAGRRCWRRPRRCRGKRRRARCWSAASAAWAGPRLLRLLADRLEKTGWEVNEPAAPT